MCGVRMRVRVCVRSMLRTNKNTQKTQEITVPKAPQQQLHALMAHTTMLLADKTLRGARCVRPVRVYVCVRVCMCVAVCETVCCRSIEQCDRGNIGSNVQRVQRRKVLGGRQLLHSLPDRYCSQLHTARTRSCTQTHTHARTQAITVRETATSCPVPQEPTTQVCSHVTPHEHAYRTTNIYTHSQQPV